MPASSGIRSIRVFSTPSLRVRSTAAQPWQPPPKASTATFSPVSSIKLIELTGETVAVLTSLWGLEAWQASVGRSGLAGGILGVGGLMVSLPRVRSLATAATGYA